MCSTEISRLVISKVRSNYKLRPSKTIDAQFLMLRAGIVAQLQSSLHKERQRAQSLEEAAARLSSEQQRLASSRDSALLAQRVRCKVTRGACAQAI